MSKDVFVSHASEDAELARRLVACLEACGIACFLAPRDIPPGAVWDEAVVDGIDGCAGMVLVLSARANVSSFVKNEINRAFSKNKTIFAFRTEAVALGKSLELYLSRHQWIDGFPGPPGEQFGRLAEAIGQWLGRPVGAPALAKAAASGGPIDAGRAATSAVRTRSRLHGWRLRKLRTTVGCLTPRERAFGVVAAALAVIVALMTIPAIRYVREVDPERTVTRFEIATPPTSNLTGFTLSPDGRQLAFVASTDGFSRLWVRRLDQVTEQPLAGTEGAQDPFWAPDGRAIGFGVGPILKRIDLAGGGLQTVSVLGPFGSLGVGAWNREDVIISNIPGRGPIYRVPATGGEALTLTRLGPGQTSHTLPQFLPDGRRFLFTVTGTPDTQGVYLGSLDGGEPMRVLPDVASTAFVPPNTLLLVRGSTLVALRFDPARGVVSGDPRTVAQPVGVAAASSRGAFAASLTGVLAYRAGGALSRQTRQLTWLDRAGRVLGTVGPPDASELVRPSLSPDGSRVAITRQGADNFADVWLVDVARGAEARFTFDPAHDIGGVWSPDGRRVFFRSSRGDGRTDLYDKPADGAAEERLLLKTDENKTALDVSPDGRTLLYASASPTTGVDLWGLPVVGDRKPFPIVQTKFDDTDGHFSPDGRWIAYESNESSGRFEVYVRPFPGPGGKWQVSTGGGSQPLWSHDGTELFYLAADGQLMAAPIAVASGGTIIDAGTPVALFTPRLASGGVVTVAGGLTTPQYAVAPDGRFLVNLAVEDHTAPITVVLNWDAELKK